MQNDQVFLLTTNGSPATDGFYTIPSYDVKTGTITTVSTGGQDGKAVVGAGTLFTTELRVGDYLASDDNTEVRRINSITSDTLCWIDEKFTTDLTGETVLLTPYSRYTKININPQTGASGKINGVAFAVQEYEWEKTNRFPLDPIAVLVSGGSVNVETSQ